MRLKVIWLLVFSILLIFKGVSAHEAVFIKSDPVNGAIMAEAPAQINAWFGEELQTGVSVLQVFNADGERVDSGDGQVDLNDPDHASLIVRLPELAEGAYLVRWYVVLLDGDTSESVFNFFVGDEVDAAAVNFEPADTTVFYYQAEEADAPGNWFMVGGGMMVLLVLLPLVVIMFRRGTV
ncbi:MAG: copper resistance protein CopC [Anaerolineae bacterium]|nr:copper resistance protein CopC [Anaerolineae bacterium]